MNTPQKPTHRKHSRYHDYSSRCIYHVTIVCSDRVPMLGRMSGESAESAHVEFTPLGMEVCKEIQDIPAVMARKGCSVQVLASVVMPDHVHFVLYVKEPMPMKMGLIIRGFKQGCNKQLRRWLEMAEEERKDGRLGKGSEGGLEKPTWENRDDANYALTANAAAIHPDTRAYARTLNVVPGQSLSPRESFLRFLNHTLRSSRILTKHALFEDDFDETILRRKGQLDTMMRYVHNNPLHRWQKQHHPNLLIPIRGIKIAGRSYDAIGNVNLLSLNRQQVWVRSRWTDEVRRTYKNDCVIKARRGYALVSPFISPHETAVRDYCLSEGHSIIQLVDNGFSDYTQCPGGLYDYCINGQVLILVPSDFPHIDRKRGISRSECVLLNSLASDICEKDI